jgi:hypothetical protein
MSETGSTQKINWRKIGEAFGKSIGVTFVILIAALVFAIVAALIVRMTAVTNVEYYEVGYSFNRWTGELKILKQKGWIFYLPAVTSVHTVDLRPWQVCINANQRVLNCKLVQFSPEGLEQFIKWHGRKSYEGGSTETGSFTDILKSYAYDGTGKNYSFLIIVRDLRPDDVAETKK